MSKELLFKAVDEGAIEKVKEILGKGIKVDSTSDYGRTPLFNAIRNKNSEMVKLLLTNGANPNFLSQYDGQPLKEAIGWEADGRNEIVKILLDHGADVNAYIVGGENKVTPLHCAASHKNKTVIKLLLAFGADTKARDDKGRKPSDWAQSSTIKKLIDGSLPTQKTADDLHRLNKDLFEAAEIGALVKVQKLVKSGGDINFKDDFGGTTPLIGSLIPRNGTFKITDKAIKTAMWLIENGADINAKSEGGHTALHQVCSIDRLDLVKLMLKKGAKITTTERTATLLHTAVDSTNNRDMKLWKFLLENGQDINAKDSEGETPLHKAVTSWNLIATKFLVKNGANISIKNGENLTAMDLAKKYKNEKIVDFFESL